MSKKKKELTVAPFLKWAGGKRTLIPHLKKKFPQNGSRFLEPFIGSGAVSLNVDYPECIISDTNRDLIYVFCKLKIMENEFIALCRKMFVQKNNTREAYGALKEEFNTISLKSNADKVRKAVLFVYLNRHCFNGLCRYNGSGEFNVPFGKYDKPYFPEKEFLAAIPKVQNFTIKTSDFREVFELVQKNDVVYCDPPYLPKSETANFNDYSTGGFSLQDQLDLAACASKAAKCGATVVISNHYSWYAKQIYVEMFGGKITTLEVSRTISCKKEERKPVKELIAVFKPI